MPHLASSRNLLALLGSLCAIAGVTAVLRTFTTVSSTTTALALLLIVLSTATIATLRIAIAASVAAMLTLNYFFLPPIGAFQISDPQNWIALGAFLIVAVIASNLSAAARARTEEAVGRRNELARLFDLSRDVLVMTDSREAISVLARSVAGRFDLDFVAIALPRSGEWDLFEGGARAVALDTAQLSAAFTAALTSNESLTYGSRLAGTHGESVRLVSLRVGAKPIGLLATGGRPIEAGTLDALAGLVAIAIERAQFLEERKTAELTRQSEALKTALLASLGHDLRTPLTAIRVAASNVASPAIAPAERLEQTDLILTEVERLTRLFENILEMARIDAGAIAAESRWAHPSEIVAAARKQVEHTLRDHQLEIGLDRDSPVKLDPRLLAAALAHLLENAAQYAPAGSTIHVSSWATGEGLSIEVRDHGPGIAPADLPHVFDRFYRGAPARMHASGTGMGLWIVRGLMAAAQGRVSAENCADGGARFTIVARAPVKDLEGAAPVPS